MIRPIALSVSRPNTDRFLCPFDQKWSSSQRVGEVDRAMLPTVELLSRLLAAAALGSLIGIERERLLWAAGLRTHMLVCVGACLAMIVSAYGFNGVLSPRI